MLWALPVGATVHVCLYIRLCNVALLGVKLFSSVLYINNCVSVHYVFMLS